MMMMMMMIRPFVRPADDVTRRRAQQLCLHSWSSWSIWIYMYRQDNRTERAFLLYSRERQVSNQPCLFPSFHPFASSSTWNGRCFWAASLLPPSVVLLCEMLIILHFHSFPIERNSSRSKLEVENDDLFRRKTETRSAAAGASAAALICRPVITQRKLRLYVRCYLLIYSCIRSFHPLDYSSSHCDAAGIILQEGWSFHQASAVVAPRELKHLNTY